MKTILRILIFCIFIPFFPFLVVPSAGHTAQLQFEAEKWHPLPQTVRSEEQPNRVTGGVSASMDIETAQGYAVEQSDTSIIFKIDGNVAAIRTMKWQHQVTTTSPIQYYAVHCKATGIRRSYDNFPVLEVISPDETLIPLLTCSDIRNDNLWHTYIGKMDTATTIKNLQITLSTTDNNAQLTVNSIVFMTELSEIASASISASVEKFRNSMLKPVDISGLYNTPFRNVVEQSINKFKKICDADNVFTAKQIVLHNIPFNVRTDGDNILRIPENTLPNQQQVTFLGEAIARKNFFPVSRDDTSTISINDNISELFFVLVSEMPVSMHRYGLPAAPVFFSDIDMFEVALHYADGTTDKAFPYSISDKGFIIQSMVGAYCVPVDSNKKLLSVTFHNKYRGANFNLGALTINTSDQRMLPQLAQEPDKKHTPIPAKPKSKALYIQRIGNELICGNTYYDMRFECGNGFAIKEIKNRYAPHTDITLDQMSGFQVTANGVSMTGLDFATEYVWTSENSATIGLKSKQRAVPLKLQITVSVDTSAQLTLNATAHNASKEPVNCAFTFPLLKSITIEKPSDTWLFFPKCKNIITNLSGHHQAPNDPSFPMQFCDTYNPNAGIGLMVLTHNITHAPLVYTQSKDLSGISTAISYPKEFYTLEPQKKLPLIETCLIVHNGDWHQAMVQYKKWVSSWNRSTHQKYRSWFNDIFLIRTEALAEKNARRVNVTPPLFNKTSKTFLINEAMKANKEYLGEYPDMIHLQDWFHSPAGEESSWGYYSADYVGGTKTMQHFLNSIQTEYHIPYSLYFIPDRCSKETPAGKKLGNIISALREDGSRTEDHEAWYVCPVMPTWQEHFVNTLKENQQQLNASAVYLDVFAFWANNTCYGKEHGHEVPLWYNKATHKIISTIRATLPDTVAIWSEYPVPDVSAQYSDGNIAYYYLAIEKLFGKTYNQNETAPLYSEPPLSVYRYVFPEVKQIDFPVGNEHMPNSINRLKAIFFNGEAHYDCTWRLYDTRVRKLLQRSLKIKKQYSDCFTSLKPEPWVPTERAFIYANKFPGNNRTAWTLYNGRYTSIHGPTLIIEHFDGATYYDAWNGNQLFPKITENKAIINLKLDPQGLGCLVQELPKQ